MENISKDEIKKIVQKSIVRMRVIAFFKRMIFLTVACVCYIIMLRNVTNLAQHIIFLIGITSAYFLGKNDCKDEVNANNTSMLLDIIDNFESIDVSEEEDA